MNVLVCLRDWIRTERRNQGMEPEPSGELKLEEIMTSRENSAESSPMHDFAPVDFDYPMQIGVILRDSHEIAQVKSVTGSKILLILKDHGLAPEIPEDLYHLIKKAVTIRKHLERSRKDKDSKFRLILVESRIHRLARYYKKTSFCCLRFLPPQELERLERF
ncbi:40S ribosomal protein S13 [Capsicum baccatum]|uniref:40S ribosomal protein S13 n=1 Tax=Capsicum baccatum TaxID=33114 RepID=A0A2G2VGL6_CAPBA|nr:40S ribosomal protein S13 [Capsicum baccatum]